MVKASDDLPLMWSVGGSRRWTSKELRGNSGVQQPGVDLQEDYFCILSPDCGRLTVTRWSAEVFRIQSLELGLWPALTDCR